MIAEAALAAALIAGTVSMPAVPPPPTASVSDPLQKGLRPSAYEGAKYRERDEQFRRCVAQREGRFQYFVTGSNGFYQGTYQFTSALARGAAWMMTAELRSAYPRQWRAIRNTLLDTPMHQWSRFYQDAAFWTVLNWEGNASGARHWAGGRFQCTPGMSYYGGDR